jgi:hypothetical protein
MKIALIGSAPSSIRLAPFGDPSWQIWACSPGAYAVLSRCDKFFELHRWEPGVIGQPATQKPWFSPEYVMWMSRQKCVVMYQPVPEIPNSSALPIETLVRTYGSYNFTSSLAWMFAMALEEIKANRLKPADKPQEEKDSIAFYGVDMAATEEYGYQRAGCQFFVQLAHQLGIEVVVPPESDLLVPPPLYGVCEHSHQFIKLTERKREIESRLANAQNMLQHYTNESFFLKGALDDMAYHMNTWTYQGDYYGAEFNKIFAPAAPVGIDHLNGSQVTVVSEG